MGRIVGAEYSFHDQYWSQIGDEAKDFVTQLLTVNPEKRMNAKQAMLHPWIEKDYSKVNVADLKTSIDMMKKFNANRKFKAAAKTVIITNRLQRKMESLGPMGQMTNFFKKTFVNNKSKNDD